ncbi:MAG: GNAT family N-acetyltransferase [Gammaproteobacteria bacterium]|nr:GNAT family N-acetyltransferase [Gammaproteobacteria bacterium]
MNIRLATTADAALLAEYYLTNAVHFRPWEPLRDHDYYSEASLFIRLTEYEEQHNNGSAAHFIGSVNGCVIAHCSLTSVLYGPFRACFMGYGVAQSYQSSGVMTKLCQAALHYAFTELKLNRVMANYMPSNTRSGYLLKKLGFSEEGQAKKYLKINGRWEDHVLTSILNPSEP